MNRTSIKALAGISAALTLAGLLAGCQSGTRADKAGNQTVVLHLASIDEVNDNGQSHGPQAFLDSLAAVSGGKLKAEVNTGYGERDPGAETALVQAIAKGEVDGGWPATRAFGRAGIGHLQSVEAPMTITNYAAEKSLVSGPVATKLLTSLDGSGVVGLGLAVGPLRRPFSAKAPLLEPADWKGISFRAFNSPIQSEAIEALGATPVNASFDWIDQVLAGTLRGGEFDVAQYAQNGLDKEAGNVASNVVLWPKVFVLSLSQKRFSTLSSQQQGWVREAAHRAVAATVSASYNETALAQQLCGRGVRFQPASPEQLSAMKATFRPVLDQLSASPQDGPLLRDITAIAAANPDPDTASSTGTCTSTVNAMGPVPSTRSALPDGVYRVQLHPQEIADAGMSNNEGGTGTWTLTVRDATYEITCRPLDLPGKDCGDSTYEGPLDVGDLRGEGQSVYFVYDAQRLAKLTGCALPASRTDDSHCFAGSPYRLDWKVSGGQLVFSDWTSDHSLGNSMTIKPWRKIS